MEERHLSRHGSSPDYLTCGDCAREFLLENITLFIAHKKWGCTENTRARRRTDGSDDLGEDTSSPLTCSVCSRVFMTARGLLHHVQLEHGMTICLKRGPLIILDKSLRCPEVNSPSDLDTKHRHLKSPSTPSHENVDGKAHSPSAYSMKPGAGRPPVRQRDSFLSKSEAISGNVGNPDEIGQQHQKDQRRGREQSSHENSNDQQRNLSQSSNVSANSIRNRFNSEERDSLNDQEQPGKQTIDQGNSGPDKERTPRSSSVPKKRRFAVPDQSEEYDKDFRALSQDEVFVQSGVGYPGSATINDNMSSRRKGYLQGETMDEPGKERLGCAKDAIDLRSDQENIDTGQYYSDRKDMESPICLVVSKASDLQGTVEDNVKNVILKKLLLHNGTTESIEYAPEKAEGSSPMVLPIMPKLEIDTTNLLVNPFDTSYSEAEDRPQSNSISTASCALQQHGQQRSYMRARYSRFAPGASMEQSIEQIIRATVSKEMEDLSASNDSLERSPPHLLSPRFTGSHTLQGATNSFQGIPMTMPSLIASHQLGAVAGYFSPQHYPSASPRRSSVGPPPHPISRSAATSPGSMSAPEKAIDISSPLETSGMYPGLHDGSSLPRLGLGYHNKTGMDMVRRGASDFTGGLRHGTPSIYRGEVDIHHWAAMAGDAYVNSMTNRISSEQQHADAHGISADFDDRKALLDGSLKKRRYPTSRPFKCAHCDQAFNQRIHLKKHMSKHTGVKPFKCQQCDYSTVERSHLKVHYRIHTGEKPYRCMFCDYATAQNSTLKIHLKRHHEGQQLSTKDMKPGKNMRRENHRVQLDTMCEDVESGDSIKIPDNHEVDREASQACHDKGYSQSNAAANKRQTPIGHVEKNSALGTTYLNKSRSPRQEPRDVESDAVVNYHKYQNHHAQSGYSSALVSGPDRDSGTSRNIAKERGSTPAWHELPESRQRGHMHHQQEHRNRMSSPGDPDFLSDRPLKIHDSPSRGSNEEKVVDPAPLNFSSSASVGSWKGQQHIKEEGKDMTKHQPEGAVQKMREQDPILKEPADMSHGSGVVKVSQQEVGAAVAEKPEDDEDGYSDDDMEHVDYEVVKVAVIPDKAFVRG